MRKQKTLADFPRFTVHSLRKYPPGDQGYTDFELEGTFDRTIQRSAVTWFWLLSGERESLCVQWKSQDDTIAPTVLVGCQKDVPQLDGAILFYLNPYWQPFHVWMVLDSQWGWEKVKFEASDAVALETEGREVKGWTKLKRTDSDDQSSQQYPVNKDASGYRIVEEGWDHEHCELCSTHIDARDFGYRDPDDHWMCGTCYEKYVIPHDLSFACQL